MRSFSIVFLVLIPVLGISVCAQADENITVVADSTFSGNVGFVVHSVQSDDSSVSVFMGLDSGKVRIYGIREFGSQNWDELAEPQYFVGSSPMNIGDTWRFLDSDDGIETEAEVVALESITVVAGTFSAYRVEIVETNAPNEPFETMWLVEGVGFVRNQGFLNGELDWTDDLRSYSIVGGSGFFPWRWATPGTSNLKSSRPRVGPGAGPRPCSGNDRAFEIVLV